MRVKFTLNGKEEEIGMGLAFSDEGFRPSHGVYAYVCLNRCVTIFFICRDFQLHCFIFQLIIECLL
jgi:hypothetical protein